MRRIRTSVLIALAIVGIVTACNGGLTPPSGPNTEYPCGVRGVVCPGSMCCDENEICGGGEFPRCEPGMCCFDGPHWPGASLDGGPDAGARVPKRQHPAQSR